MNASLLAISRSHGFRRHVTASLPADVEIFWLANPAGVTPAQASAHDLVVVHAGSMGLETEVVVERLSSANVPIAVAADAPDLDDMLSLSRHHIKGYFNSWMADVHYRQMVELLKEGLTWFSPPMMADALDLARNARTQERPPAGQPCESVLRELTLREQEIAQDVASGLTNQEIAHERHITERTVKSHLTRIFRKLGTRNRHALAVKVRGF